MRSGMEKFSRMARGRFYLAMTYLVWSLIPHFHVLIHSHAGDSHFHASYSATQVEMANRVLETLGPEDAEATPADFGGNGIRNSTAPAGSSSGDISRPDAGSEMHGHFWEEPNLAGLASLSPAAPLRADLVPAASPLYQDPSLRVILRAAARGPPALPPA